MHAFAPRAGRRAPPETPPPPVPLRHAGRQTRALPMAPDARCAPTQRTAVGPHSPDPGTFVAGTRRWDFGDSSLVRIHAQSRAELESPRARVPYIAGCEFSPVTVLLTGAQTTYFKRYRRAYGHGRSEVGALHRTFSAKFSQPHTVLSMETANPSNRRRQPTGHAFVHRHPFRYAAETP